jgi:hypothetical protein
MRGGLHFMVVAGGFFSFFNTVALPVSKPKYFISFIQSDSKGLGFWSSAAARYVFKF